MPVSAPAFTPTLLERRALAFVDALARGRTIPFAEEWLDQKAVGPRRVRPVVARSIERRLRRAVVRFLARGGWCREEFLANETPVVGRLWERRPIELMPLTFTRRTLDLVERLAAGGFGPNVHRTADDSPHAVRPSRAEGSAPNLSLGDRVFFLRLWSTLRETPAADAFRRQSDWTADVLTRALFPGDFAEDDVAGIDTAEVGRWLAAENQWIVEAMRRPLADAWSRDAAGLRSVGDGARWKRAGAARRRLLDAWTRAVDAAGRRDLALWIVAAARRALDDASEAEPWFSPSALATLSPADGAEAARDALSLFTTMERLSHWTLDARRTGFVDEGYAAAQQWLRAWELLDGDATAARARVLIDRALHDVSRPIDF